jgi:ribosomal protein S18 acetylase RimI-like enzyme
MSAPTDIRIDCPATVTPADVEHAHRLVDRCNQTDGLDLPLEVNAESVADGSIYGLAWSGAALIGLLGIHGRHEPELCLAVTPEWRRRGIGRALLETGKATIRQRGNSECLLVTDEASAAARAFVAAVGGQYHGSEYRLVLDEAAVPIGRAWPNPVELRQGMSADVEVIARIVAESFGDEAADIKPWVERTLPLENHRFFIGSVGGEPIGNIRTNSYGSVIYITTFGVLPEWRGRGFGRQMLLRTVDRLIAENWPKILIEVETNNRNALGLYLSCGFKEATTYGFYRLKI